MASPRLHIYLALCVIPRAFGDESLHVVESDSPDSNFDDEVLVRLESLKKKTEARLIEIEETNKTVQALVASLEKLEGQDCKEGYFHCGGGEFPQCISNLQVCDQNINCKNGADEHTTLCRRPMPVGSIWLGPLPQSRCSDHLGICIRQLVIGVTKVRTLPWYPSKAEVSMKWTSSANAAQCGMNITTMFHGHFHYGLRQLTLTGDSPDLGHVDVTCQLDAMTRLHITCQMPLNPAIVCEEVILRKL